MLCQTKRSLDNKEWERCSVSETSRLYQLSNPKILCGGVENDTVVIKQLIDMVFMKYFHLADPRQMIGDSKVEERQGLNQEIQEAVRRNKKQYEGEEDSGDEWLDQSYMEDCDY